MKPGVSTQPPPVKTTTVTEYVIEWLFEAAKAAAEQERLRKAARKDVEESQKACREGLRDKHPCYW